MAPLAPSKTSSYSPVNFSFKKKLVESLSSKPKSDIAAPSKTDVKAKIAPAYDWETAPSPFTPQNAPKTIGALFGGGVTSEQTAPLPAPPAPTPTISTSVKTPSVQPPATKKAPPVF